MLLLTDVIEIRFKKELVIILVIYYLISGADLHMGVSQGPRRYRGTPTDNKNTGQYCETYCSTPG